MASRPELVMMCIELKINWTGMSIQKMKSSIKEKVDFVFNRRISVSADSLSDTLKKFITTEYDYKIYNKDGKQVNYKGEII